MEGVLNGRETHTLGKEQEGKQMGWRIWVVIFFMTQCILFTMCLRQELCCQSQGDSLASDQHEKMDTLGGLGKIPFSKELCLGDCLHKNCCFKIQFSPVNFFFDKQMVCPPMQHPLWVNELRLFSQHWQSNWRQHRTSHLHSLLCNPNAQWKWHWKCQSKEERHQRISSIFGNTYHYSKDLKNR